MEGLSAEQKQEAIHEANQLEKRAEARAEQRAIEKAIECKRIERLNEKSSIQKQTMAAAAAMAVNLKKRETINAVGSSAGGGGGNGSGGGGQVKFVSKRQRLALEQKKLQEEKDGNNGGGKKKEESTTAAVASSANKKDVTRRPAPAANASRNSNNNSSNNNNNSRGSSSNNSSSNNTDDWTDRDRQSIRETYLGVSNKVNMTNEQYMEEKKLKAKKNMSKRTKSGKKTNFRFNWDDTDDTLPQDDPLYQGPSMSMSMGGNGHGGRQGGGGQRGGGQGQYDSRNNNNNNNNRNNNYDNRGGNRGHSNNNYHNNDHRGGRYNDERGGARGGERDRYGGGPSRGGGGGDGRDRYDNRRGGSNTNSDFENSIDTKPLQEMTSRDWRIYRENHNIVCKGGKAPPPLRFFNDGQLLHISLLKALKEIMFYNKPTPIQRQAIPIGMQRRDLIGIAETGSGKTCAFGIPLIQYILMLPASVTTRSKVAEHGPLAIVLAPTRELALQIDGEFQKLLTFCIKPNQILSACIVGGQNMTVQAQKLRDGIHIVVGTPGRINECLELTYMVLNQCSYCVLDEGDRMIDMGFAPQLESILDHMGGSLKSENESEAYEQEKQDLQTLQTLQQQQQNSDTTSNNTNTTIELPKHRVTAMFSATMPLEVEQMAKKYLRFPAVISVGDRDSRKNARIEQKVIFLSSPSAKEGALRKLILDPRFIREKVLVFVNEKKHCEGVSRQIERIGRRCVVLHGGKSQEEREKNLQLFKQGGVILVATDVAGRGLDISNIAHVINYDLPGRSIDSYSHRIGRTGRAGKAGLATSLLTDDDEGIMAPLKAYLESTGSVVPDKLARHPACNGGSDNNVIY